MRNFVRNFFVKDTHLYTHSIYLKTTVKQRKMAVGFFVDDGEEHLNSPYQTAVITTVHSATQTPLQSPVNREYLVQAFCEALQRINIASKCYASKIKLFLLLPFLFTILQFHEKKIKQYTAPHHFKNLLCENLK